MRCGFFVFVCMHVYSCSSTPLKQTEAQLQGVRHSVLASISSCLAATITTCIHLSIYKSRQIHWWSHFFTDINNIQTMKIQLGKHNYIFLYMNYTQILADIINKIKILHKTPCGGISLPKWKSVNENAQQTLEWKSCRSPLRFVWMQNNKFRQTVVDPCDQATWLPGQASGVHSTVLHK